MRTYVYIDGFNFYYGAVKGTPYKWLDFKALCEKILPGKEILKIKYFTADVQSWPTDPEKPRRQGLFLSALRQFPEIEIIKGKYQTKPKKRVLAFYPSEDSKKQKNFATAQRVWIMRSEEKGSDVNLAVHLLNDAYMDRFDLAVIVSNDSDLAEAVRLTQEVDSPSTGQKKIVGVVNPQIQRGKRRPAKELHKAAQVHFRLTFGDLADCQLPQQMPGTRITKPAEW